MDIENVFFRDVIDIVKHQQSFFLVKWHDINNTNTYNAL